MGNVNLPITDASGKAKTATEHFKLMDGLQLGLGQLGDGFFPLKGKTFVGTSLRDNKDLNAEIVVTPGPGLRVGVRDWVALIDGVMVGDKNKRKFTPLITLPVTFSGPGVWHLTLKAEDAKDPNGIMQPDWSRGIVSVETSKPALNSGKVLIGTVAIPSGATAVTAPMINNSVKSRLVDVGDLNAAMKSLTAAVGGGGGGGGGGGAVSVEDLGKLAALILNVEFDLGLVSSYVRVQGRGMFSDTFGGSPLVAPGSDNYDAGLTSGIEFVPGLFTSIQGYSVNGVRASLVYAATQAEAAGVTKSAGWTTVADAAASGGSLVQATTAARTLTMPFTGTDVQIVCPTFPSGGSFTVSVDGALVGAISQGSYLVGDQADRQVFGMKNLVPGAHTLVITSQANATAVTKTFSGNGNSAPTSQGYVLSGYSSDSSGVILGTDSVGGGFYSLSKTGPGDVWRDFLNTTGALAGELTNVEMSVTAKFQLEPNVGYPSSAYAYLQLDSTDPANYSGGYMYAYIALNQQVTIYAYMPQMDGGYCYKNTYINAVTNNAGTFDPTLPHTYKAVFNSVAGTLKVYIDNVDMDTMPGASTQEVLPTGSFVGGVPHLSLYSSVQSGANAPQSVSVSAWSLTGTQLPTTVKIDAIKIGNRPAGVLVTQPFASTSQATQALVSRNYRLNNGTIAIDVLDGAGAVLLADATEDTFQTLSAPGSSFRLRARLSGDAIMTAWGAVVK